ncbi:glucose-repressible protein [Ophiostoma piceae UAMH 11346]|uniref:Glucose-repressible protein n=1 Tax=Ophiostoma piceae (strain UAMH 11346) TaxID=1262450 RepID=S3BP02_OPHP1|nr:glucose-repressible protein [Ophiostoma piceae UAMH 11346]
MCKAGGYVLWRRRLPDLVHILSPRPQSSSLILRSNEAHDVTIRTIPTPRLASFTLLSTSQHCPHANTTQPEQPNRTRKERECDVGTFVLLLGPRSFSPSYEVFPNLYIRQTSLLPSVINFFFLIINHHFFKPHHLPINQTNKSLAHATKPTFTMDTIKNTANFVSDKINAATSGASHEANKNIAQDSNQGIGNRVDAAGSAIKDKFDQKGSEASAEANKQSVKH